MVINGGTGGASLQLAGVAKRYGRLAAVDSVELDVAAGEFLTLLGPSGSGKTTLLNIVAGFVQPDDGAVLLDGQPITHTPPHRRGFGIVFQNYAIFPHLSVRENIAFPLRRRGWSATRIEEAVGRALALVNLDGLGARRPDQLSGGQQQRVAFARAVVFQPPVLLMDEPLSALDRNLRQQLQLELRALHRQLGLTVILVTHDQDEAMTMSDRIAVMDRGRIVQVGTTRELYDRPQTPFVARFFGETNTFEATAALQDGRLVARLATGMLALPGGSAAPDARITVFIRPNRIRLASPGAAPLARAVVRDTLYLGNTLRATLALSGGPELVAELPGYQALSTGDEVALDWSSDDIRVFRRA